MDKIFCDYDRAHLYWGDKEKLDAHAVGSEVVVDQIRKKQQTVGRANREGEIGIVSNGVRAVGIAAHVKQQQHNDRHDQSKEHWAAAREDRKSTRLNSSHPSISYAVFCLKKKKKIKNTQK